MLVRCILPHINEGSAYVNFAVTLHCGANVDGHSFTSVAVPHPPALSKCTCTQLHYYEFISIHQRCSILSTRLSAKMLLPLLARFYTRIAIIFFTIHNFTMRSSLSHARATYDVRTITVYVIRITYDAISIYRLTSTYSTRDCTCTIISCLYTYVRVHYTIPYLHTYYIQST